MQYQAIFYLAASLLINLSQATVWGPEVGGSRGRGQIQPRVIDFPVEASDQAVDNVNT